MTPILSANALTKAFGGVPVLKGVSLSVGAGEVVALAGENGAGKSTFMKIMTGLVQPDSGTVSFAGEVVHKMDPLLARDLGIGIIPQELAPYPDLTVYENLFVGREIKTSIGSLDRRAMIAEARSMLAVYDLDIDPRTHMRDLSVSLTQLVEIAKATTLGGRVLLLDEPTSSIPEREVERLFAVIRKLKEQGMAMIYTTHRMMEIQELADRVVVLRDGNLVLDVPKSEAPENVIVRAMIGRDLDSMFPEKPIPQHEVGLRVEGLQVERGGPLVSLNVRKGEILGIGGLVGAGRTELLEAIFGFRRSYAGDIVVADQVVRRNNPAEAIRAGVALVPEDRKGAGLVLMQSVLDNGSLPHLRDFSIAGWLKGKKRKNAVRIAADSVSLKYRGLDQQVGTLSGGNQQKVVIAKWLTETASVLLLDEPTRGVDVGARGEIYSIIRSLAAAGMSVLLVSSDMPELIGLSNRVMVMRDGFIAAEIPQEELELLDIQERIFRHASGMDQNSEHGHVA
ncbi:MAG: sugar ABC transporter ATP-binding protein [Actinomycetales bacterium]|nr:sugar ABC transporter ATP-binding protein [Actinomycetales bacterium]